VSTPVTEWPTNLGVTLRGYRADGYGWIAADGVAVFRFEADGPVTASPTDDQHALEALWLSSVLPLVVQARGTQVLHASAVAGTDGIVALCGVSGSGKTTLAAALMQRGHEPAADDALPFYTDDSRVMGHPLPFSLRLRPGSAALLSAKGLVASRVRAEAAALGAVVLLRPTVGAGAALTHTPPVETGSELVAEMLPHLYCFSLAEGKQELVGHLFTLLRTVPVFALDYPHDEAGLEAACDLLEELL
jgi:hypothetical protein